MKPSPNWTYSYKDFIDSPEGLADSIAEILGCPVTIEDANHFIVSYSKHEQNVDHARTATIMRRKVPEHVINGLWKHGFMAKLLKVKSLLLFIKLTTSVSGIVWLYLFVKTTKFSASFGRKRMNRRLLPSIWKK